MPQASPYLLHGHSEVAPPAVIQTTVIDDAHARMDRIEQHMRYHLRLYSTLMRAHRLDESQMITLFPLSLSGAAQRWFASLESSWRKTWDDLAQEFLLQFSFNNVVDVSRRELEALRQSQRPPRCHQLVPMLPEAHLLMHLSSIGHRYAVEPGSSKAYRGWIVDCSHSQTTTLAYSASDDSDPEPIVSDGIYEIGKVLQQPPPTTARPLEGTSAPKEVRRDDNEILRQLQSTQARISIWSLLASSNTHRDTLIRVLSQIRVETTTTTEGLIHMVMAGRATCIVFSNDDLPLEGSDTYVHFIYQLVIQAPSPIYPFGQWLSPECLSFGHIHRPQLRTI
ncbi:hypothetical protein CK203_049692 [Vitis vinifera]|uniref:Retrotransposon gag domain-containing protein n=1 Tax=Vitis vinifera TaxID=29760 RepID=A0A438H109_VITVI|nr:hypothetical protein CK203_049692 [Vitis vinifera]